MSIFVYNGLPGQGKTTKMASIANDLFIRNEKILKKYNKHRYVYSNMKFTPEVEHRYGKFIKYWTSLDELIQVRDSDVIFDEIATFLDSTQWQNTSLAVKRWLQQHRHFGIDIYGTTQDFKTVDISMRRLVKKAYWVRKMFGTRDISSTLPPIKKPWALVMIREIEFDSFTSDSQDYKFSLIPSFMWISKRLVNMFDTTEDLKAGQYPPLQHIDRKCLVCGLHKAVHY